MFETFEALLASPVLLDKLSREQSTLNCNIGKAHHESASMINNRHRKDDALADLSKPEIRLLMDFVRISTRPNTSGRAAERRLMSSLTFAIHATGRAC